MKENDREHVEGTERAAAGIETATAMESEERGAEESRGADRDAERRPGVPMEAEPQAAEGTHWREPETQVVTVRRFKRQGLERLTPVVGTAQPPRGLSGVLRRIAYQIPEYRARHWGLLRLADRIDVLEGSLGTGLGAALRLTGMRQMARRVERNPLPTVAGALVAGYAVGRAVRRGRSLTG